MFNSFANKFRRVTSNQKYLAEIDGIRFLSLVLVAMFHIRGYFLKKTTIVFADNINDYYWLNRFFINADRRMSLFFVISGFILCLPFANHYLKGTKKIKLKTYYLRRLTRLEPPYFIVMICLFLLQLLMHVHTFKVLFPSLLASLTYTHNIIFHRPSILTVVAWTLEIEVQFYLIAPLLFKVLALPHTTRRLLLASLIVFLAVFQYIYPPHFLSIYSHFRYFLAGILLADIYVCGFATDFFAKKWLALLTPVLFLTMFFLPRWEKHPKGLAHLPYGIMFPFMLVLFFYIILKNDIVKRVFSYKFIPIIGGMCYSVYLVHYTVISVVGRYTTRITFTPYYIPNLLLQFVLLCIPILIVAAFFYLYIERPFMSRKWVDKLMKKTTATEVKA